MASGGFLTILMCLTNFSKCITTFEDKRFLHHPGIDPVALTRAFIQNIRTKNIVSGGSTLTMQVIRLSRSAKRRNILNKIIESILAVRLECGYHKNTILSLYASNAPFGSNVVGLDAASWRYYARPANENGESVTRNFEISEKE